MLRSAERTYRQLMSLRGSALVLGLAATALLLPGATPARFLPADFEIFVIGVDGSGRRNVSANPQSLETSPVVSPDGTKVAFLRVAASGTDIWVMNADGSRQIRRTETSDAESDPAWAPDSRTLAFTYQTAPTSPPGIRVLTATGGGPRRANAQHARFAPVGQFIVFEDLRPGRLGIARMRRNGSGYRALFRATTANPVWSPAGKRVAYERIVGDRTYVSVMNADGSKRRRLAAGADPVWSARGLIAFVRDGDLHVIQPNGRGLRRLTSTATVASPTWSRDGRRLAFLQGPGVAKQVYVVNADGSGLARVTSEPAGAGPPAWSRNGRSLYYAARILERPPPP
jgi:Tol biopolymer transport system component